MRPPVPNGLDDSSSPSRSRSVMTDKVLRTVAAHLGLRRTELTIHSHLRNNLHADLLDRIELGVTVEEQFGVRIPLEASMQAETVGDLIAVLKRAMDSKRRAISFEASKTKAKEEDLLL